MANIAHEARNKYTLHGKVAALQSAVEQLDAAHRRIKCELLTELQQYLDAHCHGMNGKDGVDGRPGSDCQCREVKGDKGDKGDITVVGDAELLAAVTELKLRLAKWQGAVLFAAEQNGQTKHSGLKKAIELTLKGIEKRANS